MHINAFCMYFMSTFSRYSWDFHKRWTKWCLHSSLPQWEAWKLGLLQYKLFPVSPRLISLEAVRLPLVFLPYGNPKLWRLPWWWNISCPKRINERHFWQIVSPPSPMGLLTRSTNSKKSVLLPEGAYWGGRITFGEALKWRRHIWTTKSLQKAPPK